MFKQETAQLIKQAAKEERLNFFQLDDNEKRVIVAHLLYQSDQGLIDADHHQHIQHAVAHLIFNKADPQSIVNLINAIETAFIIGTSEYEPHYADDIQTLLSEEWDEENRRPNEHYENDMMQRTRELRDEQRRLQGIF